MSQEAGYAIMGRIALFNQRWDEAITAYKNVVGKVQLFKSGDGTDYAANYADLFKEQNETAAEVAFQYIEKHSSVVEEAHFEIELPSIQSPHVWSPLSVLVSRPRNPNFQPSILSSYKFRPAWHHRKLSKPSMHPIRSANKWFEKADSENPSAKNYLNMHW